VGFSRIDLGIVLIYLVGVTALGSYFRRRQRSIHDYFLGGRTTPTWALTLSIVATETSALTIIGTPALAYASNLAFLQLTFGYIIARFLISSLLLPHYFAGELYTAYQYVERRFGAMTKKLTAGLFLVTRALAEGVRVFAISLVVSAVLGTDTLSSILVITLVTLFYTFEGGMQAVIWTDVVQFLLYVAGGLIVLWQLLQGIPGGWTQVTQLAQAAGNKFAVLDFSFAWDKTYTFWAGVVGGTFLTMASHGTDQLLVQRLLAAGNLRKSQVALIVSGFIVLVQFLLFLIVGVLLYAFYQHFPPPTPLARTDQVLPAYMVAYLPTGIAGVMVAAVLAAAMSTSSATLNSLAASTVVDFRRRQADQARLLRRSRLVTLVWGVVMIALALWAQRWGPVLEAGLTIASITYGAMLGVFLLGRLTHSANPRGVALGMVIGLATILYVRFFTAIAWTWYVLIGTLATFSVGYLASQLLPTRRATAE